MKFSIIFIFALFPIVEIQLIHCSGNNEKLSNGFTNKGNAVIPPTTTFSTNESDGEGDVGPSESRTFGITSIQNVHPAMFKGAMKNLEKLNANTVDEMRKKATANYETAIKKAELVRQEADSKIKLSIEKLDKECDKNIKIAENKLLNEDAIAMAILRAADRKFNEMEKRLISEIEQATSLARKNFEKAEHESDEAVEAADNKFLATYSELEKRRQKLESKHRDELEKGRKKREAALKVAHERKEQAEKEYRALRKRKGSSRDATKAKYEAEIEKYDEAVELAENQWQKVLENVGLGREYEEAVEKAATKLRESQDQASILRSKASDQLEAFLQKQKPDDELTTVISSALANNNAARKQYNETHKNSVNKFNSVIHRTQRKCKKARAPLIAAQEKVQNEYKNAVAKAKEEYESTLKKATKMPGNATINKGRRRTSESGYIIVTNVSNADAAKEVEEVQHQ